MLKDYKMMCPYICIFRAFQKNPSISSFILRTSLIKDNQNLKRDEIGQNSHHQSNNGAGLGEREGESSLDFWYCQKAFDNFVCTVVVHNFQTNRVNVIKNIKYCQP